ncbi:MAG TPA: hypothetical protein VFA61_00590 [Candidatus Udaeobacter sp.]|nr:hypothetical protein [Candidatus Udaeobacter sp.]
MLTEARLERERLYAVVATIVINIATVSLLTLAPWSDWRTGAALNILDNCLLVGFALVRRDALVGRFLLFGSRSGILPNFQLMRGWSITPAHWIIQLAVAP